MVGVSIGALIGLLAVSKQLKHDRSLFEKQARRDRELFEESLKAERERELQARRRVLCAELAAELEGAARRLHSWEDLDAYAPDWPDYKSAGDVLAKYACHEHGTGLTGFLPASWDHLGCQSWDHPARLLGLSSDPSLTACVMSVDAEVVEGGIQGGQRG